MLAHYPSVVDRLLAGELFVLEHLAAIRVWLRAVLDMEMIGHVKNILFLFVVAYVVLAVVEFVVVGVVRRVVRDGPGRTLKSIYEYIARTGIALLKKVPFAQAKIDAELGKVIGEIEAKLRTPEWDTLPVVEELPVRGWTDAELRRRVGEYRELDRVDWKGGKVSGTVYHGGKELSAILSETYAAFSHTNPLHPDVFPSVRRMEAEVIAMCVRLYNGDPRVACGSVTSGGTESILMACKTYRERARHLKGITKPQMIVPVTVHAAFDKAAAYFGIEIIHAPMNPITCKVDVGKVRSLITANTIMLAGSAPNYPHGVIDDIVGLAALALRYDIGLHVDCCLGSFIVPFLAQAGFPAPLFDLRVAGVTSISCDTHKFGFAPKGSSVVMYADKNIRKYQYFVAPNWPGGIYASPSIAGSRPGALVAACWAALNKNGKDGYLQATKAIVGAAQKIAAGIRRMNDIELCGEPEAMVVAFRSKTISVYKVADEMTKKGWNLNTLQHPPAVHICCTLPTVPVVDQFLRDLEACVTMVKADPAATKDGMGAIYGMAASIPDKSLVVDIAKGYLDVLTKI